MHNAFDIASTDTFPVQDFPILNAVRSKKAWNLQPVDNLQYVPFGHVFRPHAPKSVLSSVEYVVVDMQRKSLFEDVQSDALPRRQSIFPFQQCFRRSIVYPDQFDEKM